MKRRRLRTVFALIATGVATEVFLGLKKAATIDGVTTAFGLPPVGTCADVLAKSAGVLVAGLGVNRWSNMLDAPRDDGLNSDLEKASGRAIAAVIGEHLPKLKGKAEDLEGLAGVIVKQHDPEALDVAAGELPVDIAAVVSDPAGFLNGSALSKEQWTAYLRRVAKKSEGLSPLRIGSNISIIAAALSETGPGGYNQHLYMELKADAGVDGRAFGGAVLRMLNTTLEQVKTMHEDISSSTDAIWASVRKLREELDIPAMTASLERVISAQAHLADEVAALGGVIRSLPGAIDELLLLALETFEVADAARVAAEAGRDLGEAGLEAQTAAKPVLEETLETVRRIEERLTPSRAPVEERATGSPLPEGRLDLRSEDRAYSLEDLVHGVLPAHSDRFDFEHNTAWTVDDEASLGLIGAAIESCANAEIQVIGRGPQTIDLNTDAYVAAAARAIVRGVTYRRVLYIDESLPANGVLWLLLLERFMAEPRWRGQVELRIPDECPRESNAVPQFQILDRAFVHRTTRFYADGEAGADRKVRADFSVSPSRAVGQAVDDYERLLPSFGAPLTHADVADRLTRMLEAWDEDGLQFHWKHVLLADKFLDGLEVDGLPSQHVHFVGCLMPTTFTHEAASLFASRASESGDRFVPLPFETLDEAIEQFNPGALEYLCVPVENTKIGSIVPPMESYSYERLKREAEAVAEIRVPVRFVVASMAPKPRKYRGLVAVQPALAQLVDVLDPKLAALSRNPDAAPQSNHAAAQQASLDPKLVALTTEAAAIRESLVIHDHIPGPEEDVNETVFRIFKTRREEQTNS